MEKLRYMVVMFLLTSVFLLNYPVVTHAALVKDQNVKLKINNSYLLYSLQELPYIDGNGRTLLPLRLIGDLFGAQVSWVSSTQTAVVVMGEDRISLKAGEKKVTVNGKTVEMDTIPMFKNSTTMLPVRFIADSFDLKIEYNKENNIVHISDPRLLASERLSFIDEMERLNEDYDGELMPESVSFIENSTNKKLNKLQIKVLNHSSRTVKKGQLNRNTFFYYDQTNLSFIGTRGMISSDGSTGYNEKDISTNTIYNDEINWESLGKSNKGILRYILTNYFVTVS